MYQKLDRNGNLSSTADEQKELHKHSTEFSQCSVDISNLCRYKTLITLFTGPL